MRENNIAALSLINVEETFCFVSQMLLTKRLSKKMFNFSRHTGAMSVALLSMQGISSRLSLSCMVFVGKFLASNLAFVVVGLSTPDKRAALQLVVITRRLMCLAFVWLMV